MPTLELGGVDARLDVRSITCRRAIARAERWRASAVVARSSRGSLASRIAGALEMGDIEAKLSWSGDAEFVTRGMVVGAWYEEDARERPSEDRLVVDMQRTSFEPRRTSPYESRWRIHTGRTLADILRVFSDIVELPVAMTNELARVDITHLPDHESGHVLQCGESDWDFLCMLLRACRILRPSMQVTLGSVHAATEDRGHWRVVPGSLRQLRDWGMDGDRALDVERDFRIAESLTAFDARTVAPSVRAADDMAVAVPIWRYVHEETDVQAWSSWIERELPLVRGPSGGMITEVVDRLRPAGDARNLQWTTDLTIIPPKEALPVPGSGEARGAWTGTGTVVDVDPRHPWVRVALDGFEDGRDEVDVLISTPSSGESGRGGLHFIPSAGTPVAILAPRVPWRPPLLIGNVRTEPTEIDAPGWDVRQELHFRSAAVRVHDIGAVTVDSGLGIDVADPLEVSAAGAKAKLASGVLRTGYE